MRIGINARRLEGQRLGIGRYIEYMVRYWDAMFRSSERGVLFVRKPLNAGEPKLSDSFETRLLEPALTGITWENLVLPTRGRAVDVLFCPNYSVPLAYPGRTVVAIHSMNEVWSGTHPWSYRLTYSPVYRLSAKRADRVIVPSQSTLEDIKEYYRIPPDKIDVIPQGADDSFQPVDDEAALRETRQRWLGADRPYIVFVGKLSQRRNIPVLVEAFGRLKKEEGIPHSLLLMGPNHLGLPLEELASKLGIADSVVQTDGRVSDHRELVLVYNAADLYVNASAYEGFSLTIVEAMACGTPVVAVNRAAQREIADGSALLVDEATADDLADAMRRVLTDPELHRDLRARGLDRARSFRWEETARQTLDVLRRVADA